MAKTITRNHAESNVRRFVKPLLLPSKYSMKVIMGYAAAAKFVETSSVGEIEINLN